MAAEAASGPCLSAGSAGAAGGPESTGRTSCPWCPALGVPGPRCVSGTCPDPPWATWALNASVIEREERKQWAVVGRGHCLREETISLPGEMTSHRHCPFSFQACLMCEPSVGHHLVFFPLLSSGQGRNVLGDILPAVQVGECASFRRWSRSVSSVMSTLVLLSASSWSASCFFLDDFEKHRAGSAWEICE